jgi:hypothetical protein
VHQFFFTVAGVSGLEVFSGMEIYQSIEIFIGFENDVSSPASIASVGSSFIDIFLTAEVGRTVASPARFTLYYRDITKFAHVDLFNGP